MAPRQTPFSIPEGGAATLPFSQIQTQTQTQTQTPESIDRIEQDPVGMLRNDLRGLTTHDPGAIEFDSWIARLH